MTWDRPTLKTFAKNELRISYWSSFLVCLLGGLLGSYASGGSARVNFTVRSGSDEFYYYFHNPEMLWRQLIVMVPVGIVAFALALAYATFVAGPLRVGMARYFTQAPKGDRAFSNLFWGFSGGHYMGIVKTMFITNLVIGVGFILFIIPGIILHYKYNMVPYILAQEPHLETREAMQLSDRMTQNDKLNIFVLELSFTGWYLLGALLFGIGVLFVAPYVEATFAQLYGALTFKVTGSDPYSSYRTVGGYPPHGGPGAYPPPPGAGGYQWGSQQPGGYTPPNQSGDYTPPPPPPYGTHHGSGAPDRQPADHPEEPNRDDQ